MNDVDWNAVDWNLTDVEIAGRVGRSKQRVHQVRRKLGLPPSNGHSTPLSEWMSKHPGRKLRSTAREIALIFGVHPETVRKHASRHEVSLKRSIPRSIFRDNVNWKLPNKVISEIWGMANPAARRRELGIRPSLRPSWDLRRPSHWHCPRLKAAIQAEKKKARQVLGND